MRYYLPQRLYRPPRSPGRRPEASTRHRNSRQFDSRSVGVAPFLAPGRLSLSMPSGVGASGENAPCLAVAQRPIRHRSLGVLAENPRSHAAAPGHSRTRS